MITVWSSGQRPDQLAHLDDLARIEAVGRLVEDEDLGIVHQRLRNRHSLAVTARQHPRGFSDDRAQRQPGDHPLHRRATAVRATPRSRAMNARNSPTRMCDRAG